MTHSINQVKPLRISPQGRVVIPSELRKALNLKPGDMLVAWIEGDRLVLRPRRAVEAELWTRFREVEGSLSEQLIQERRLEGQRET